MSDDDQLKQHTRVHCLWGVVGNRYNLAIPPTEKYYRSTPKWETEDPSKNPEEF